MLHDAERDVGTAIRETTVGSVGELVELLTPDVDPESGRRRAPLVYRGLAQASKTLLTSLDELGGTTPPHTKVDLECHVLRTYARYARPFSSLRNGWELLVSARHHGVPTRLLDWATSPLIAAHFATLGHSDEPSVIWELNWQRLHQEFALPELTLTVEDLIEHFGAGPPTRASGDEDYLAGKTFACLIEPPSLDARIAAQGGAFTLCSDASVTLDEFLARHGLAEALARYVIPVDRLPLVRDQLDLLGIDERRVFPDLDGVAAAIRRYYE
jgi:hypothetical protein